MDQEQNTHIDKTTKIKTQEGKNHEKASTNAIESLDDSDSEIIFSAGSHSESREMNNCGDGFFLFDSSDYQIQKCKKGAYNLKASRNNQSKDEKTKQAKSKNTKRGGRTDKESTHSSSATEDVDNDKNDTKIKGSKHKNAQNNKNNSGKRGNATETETPENKNRPQKQNKKKSKTIVKKLNANIKTDPQNNSEESQSDEIIYHTFGLPQEPHSINKNQKIVYNQQNRKTRIEWTQEEKVRLLEAYEKYKTHIHKWAEIRKNAGFENRTEANLHDKHREITKAKQNFKKPKREFVLVDRNNKIVLDAVGGYRIVNEKWPHDAAKRMAKYYKMNVGDIVIIADHNNFKSVHKYLVIENDNGKYRIAALEAQYHK